MDEIYEKNIEVLKDTEEALARFASLIKEAFEPQPDLELFGIQSTVGNSWTHCIRGGL
jgi:hypothetical protein